MDLELTVASQEGRIRMTQASPNIAGWKHEEVLRILSETQRNGKTPSNVRLALIIEGGAMRGVVSASYAKALTEFVSDRQFSFIYGASSGALNSVYLAAHSIDLALDIYAENATDKRCTNLLAFPNILNVDWLVDNWMFGPRIFDAKTLHSTQSDVRIVLTRLEDGAPFYFDAKSASLDVLRQAMKATSYAPLLTEKKQVIDGVAYGDGAISDTFPYAHLVHLGATHVVCLTTRPRDYSKRIRPIERWLHRLRLYSHTPRYVDEYFERPRRYNEAMNLMLNGGSEAVPTLVIQPVDKRELPRSVESNSVHVRRIAKAATDALRQRLVGLLGVS